MENAYSFKRTIGRSLYVFALLLAGACTSQGTGSQGPGPGPGSQIDDLVSITLDPGAQTLTIEQDTPAMATFRAVGTFKDGHTEEVTSRVSFRVDARFGQFAGATFTSGTAQGGYATVEAQAGSIRGLASLTLILHKQVLVPPPAGAPALPGAPGPIFTGAPANESRKPELVYPNDKVVLPPNLGRLEFHFRKGPAENTLYALQFRSQLLTYDLYLRCQPLGDGCMVELDPGSWVALAETHRGSASDVEVTLQATDDSGTGVGTAAKQNLRIEADDIRGGIYYWTTSGSTGIMRYDFGAPTMPPVKFIGPEQTSDGKTCIGCHTISRDGKKLLAAAGTPLRGQVLLFDVAQRMPIVAPGSTPKSLFSSWSPSADQYVGVWGELDATNFNLLLFNGNTGAQAGVIDVGGTRDNPANHPDWSPDGNAIAFVRVGTRYFEGSNPRLQEMYKGQIELVRRQAAAWSKAEVVVPGVSGKNHYYPAFSPDSRLLAYCESTCPSGSTGKDCNAAMDPSAKLFAIGAQKGASPVELRAANAPGKMDGGNANLTNTFPKWSPFTFSRRSEMGGRVMWLTFSSTRRYGLRPSPEAGKGNSDENAVGALMWMIAVDPDKVSAGIDPSSPAFALPFQDLATSNHIAQWTTQIVPSVR